MEGSNTFAIIAIIWSVLEFLSCIILGNVFKIVEYEGIIEHSNWRIAITCWVLTVFTAVLFYAIYVHIDNQERIIQYQEEIIKALSK